MPGDPLGVADHGQQMTGRQRVLAVVAYADFVRKQEGIRDRPAELVAALGLGAPMDTAVSCDLVGNAVYVSRRLVVE